MNDAAIRETLTRVMKERGETYASLSRLLGRNSAYIHQFVTRGSPRHLEERDRRALARYLDIDEVLLGAEPDLAFEGATISVPRLSVQVSAGAGTLSESEFAIGAYRFDRAWLGKICRAKPGDLSIVKVAGDSMAPTLNDGDDIMVDTSDAAARLRDGIYVFRRDDMLMVKRLSLAPSPGRLVISSDNTAYPSWGDCSRDDVTVLGRVVWMGRRLS